MHLGRRADLYRRASFIVVCCRMRGEAVYLPGQYRLRSSQQVGEFIARAVFLFTSESRAKRTDQSARVGTYAAVAYFGTAVSFRHRFAQYDMVQLFSEVSGKEQRELLRFLYREVGKPLRRVKNGIKKKVFLFGDLCRISDEKNEF